MSAEQGREDKTERDMQTVVSTYVAPNLIEQADSRLIDVHNGFTNDSGYTIDYQFTDDIDRLSPEEKINVDDEDKEEELVIADDEPEKQESHNGESKTEREEKEKRCEDLGVGRKEEYRKEEPYEPSWHPHVYGKPPKKPTPHTIEYILGLSKEEKKSSVSQLMSVKRNFDMKKPYSMERSIQVQTDDRKFSLSVQKNKLQEQLLQRGVRTSECEGDGKVQYYKCEEQPLNLSVPKSKDWSAGGDDDKSGKGKFFLSLFFLY